MTTLYMYQSPTNTHTHTHIHIHAHSLVYSFIHRLAHTHSNPFTQLLTHTQLLTWYHVTVSVPSYIQGFLPVTLRSSLRPCYVVEPLQTVVIGRYSTGIAISVVHCFAYTITHLTFYTWCTAMVPGVMFLDYFDHTRRQNSKITSQPDNKVQSVNLKYRGPSLVFVDRVKLVFHHFTAPNLLLTSKY